jgi:N-dimethylarginine dimethylaminohydrolase
MIHVLLSPSSFAILPFQKGQNPYIDLDLNLSKIQSQHSHLVKAISSPVLCSLPKHSEPLPDIVFAANAGLSLPRLGYPLLLLPNMKYPQRQCELPYLKKIFRSLNLPTLDYPGTEPFEGQAEMKWMDGGRKAICGYGFRSTKQTYVELDRLFGRLYGKDKPELLVLKLASVDFYHLDIAMLEYDNRCIVHRKAFSATSIQKLEAFLGKENVTVLDTTDRFCLNAVVDGPRLLTHKLKPSIKKKLESLTGRTVCEIDASEFEKSGGSVRCMVLDL